MSRTDGDTGYANAPGQGEAYWMVGAKGTIKGPGVFEIENPPGWDIPLHVHEDEDEVHYYLEGSVTVRVGEETLTGTPGTLAYLPRGIPHALTFDEKSAGRWLWISRPDRAALLREAGVPVSEPEPSAEEIDMERVIALFAKHGMTFIEDEHA